MFIPHLERHLQDTKRLDVVWDEYIQDSLKESTHEKRGKGVRRKVSGSTKIPGNWKNFLGDQMNKKELFAFLTSKIESFSWPPTKSVCVTSGQAVSACGLFVPMDDCNDEEADTRIMVHIRHALEHGAETVLVRTVDTDVVVILVGLFFDLVTIRPSCDFWIAFGMGKNYRLHHINSICESLGPGDLDHEPYQYSMLFLAVIRHLHSTEKGRNHCGKLGRLMMALLKHSLAWPSIHLCCWMLTLTTFRSWRG